MRVGEIVFDDPKTDGSADSVYLVPSVINAINEHIKYMPYSFNYPGYLSVWEDGRFMDPAYVSKRFHAILKMLQSLQSQSLMVDPRGIEPLTS